MASRTVSARTDVAALKAAGEKLDALLALSDDEVDAMVTDYQTRRKDRR